MNFTELSLKRESCRAYQEKDVPIEIVEQILKDAVNSPSACNSQPWKFVVCTGEKAKNFHKFIIKEDSPINKWTTSVPVFVVVCETTAKLMRGLNCDSQKYAEIDAGLVASTICYSATDKGLGSCIIGVFDSEGIKNDLSIPSDTKINMIITLGYAQSENPRAKIRKEYDDVISFNKW